MNDRYCKQCGTRFTPSRDDHYFCSPKCVAAWYRANDNPAYVHAANYGAHWHTCEHCGVDFTVNDYAERSGARVPKYCSNKCKQAAYRARGKDTQQQAARRQNEPKSTPPPSSQKHTPPQDLPIWKYVGTRAKHSQPAMSDAYAILGVLSSATDAQIRAAYLAKISEWHPDRNSSPYATLWSQAINWAYDYVKR